MQCDPLIKGQAIAAIKIMTPQIERRITKYGSSENADGNDLLAIIAAITPKRLQIPKLVEQIMDGNISVIKQHPQYAQAIPYFPIYINIRSIFLPLCSLFVRTQPRRPIKEIIQAHINKNFFLYKSFPNRRPAERKPKRSSAELINISS